MVRIVKGTSVNGQEASVKVNVADLSGLIFTFDRLLLGALGAFELMAGLDGGTFTSLLTVLMITVKDSTALSAASIIPEH